MVGDERLQLRRDIASQRLQRFLAPLSPDRCDCGGWWIFSSRLPVPEHIGVLSLACSREVRIKKEANNSIFSCLFSNFSNPMSYSLVVPGDAPNAIGGIGDIQTINQHIYTLSSNRNTPSLLKKALFALCLLLFSQIKAAEALFLQDIYHRATLLRTVLLRAGK